MGKKSKKQANISTTPPPLPKHPWIYVNDPKPDFPYAERLKSLIGSCELFHHLNDDSYIGSGFTATDDLLTRLHKAKDDPYSPATKVSLIVDHLVDSEQDKKIQTVKKIREQAIKSGRNLVTINLYLETGTKSSEFKHWGSNHIDYLAGSSVDEVAESVYKQIFKKVSALEHVHLIPESKLRATDGVNFRDYDYCSIADTKNSAKDAKIQFVAVIVTKPVVVPNTQRVQWTVADKSGTGNFYFQYRGPSSQYTWDWVQRLNPGDIKALPRMPMVQIKESRCTRIAKFPFRIAGSTVTELGLIIKAVGQGVVKLGNITSLGKSSEWVPRGDVVVDAKSGKLKKMDWNAKFKKETKERVEKVENAKKASLKTLVREARKASFPEKKDRDAESWGEKSTLRDEDEKNTVSVKDFC